MLKKCKVVMLPTNQKAKVYVSRISGNLGMYNKSTVFTGNNQRRHLYIISDEHIGDGDWFIKLNQKSKFTNHPRLYKECKQAFLNSEWLNSTDVNDCFKVIASTDPSLDLPSPSNAFIKKFVDCNGTIKDVMVQYVNTGSSSDFLKVNPKFDTITIKPIKENYSKEEVCELLDAWTASIEYGFDDGLSEDILIIIENFKKSKGLL